MTEAQLPLVEETRGLALRIEEPSVGAELAPLGAPKIESRPLKYTMGELREIATTFYSSGLFKDVKSMQGCMVKILAGAELGYGPFQSMRAFHLIENKPVETSGEISARIKRSPQHDYRHWFLNKTRDKWDAIKDPITELFGCVVIVRLKKTGEWEEQEPVVFTMDDAATAGLANKTNWKSYKRAMLFARTITEAARAHCADLFGGPIYTAEELGASVTFDKEGNEVLDALAPSPPPVDAPPTNDGIVPDRTVDNEQTRATGVKTCTAFASNRKIPDAWRHELSQAMLGKSSTKEMDTGELRRLYDLLRKLVKDRGEDAWDRDSFSAWLEFQVATGKEDATGS